MTYRRMLPLALSVGVLGGCALNAQPNIPGFDEKVTIPEEVPVAQVINALRCQLARAFDEINSKKAEDFDTNGSFTTATQQISYQTGSVSLSGVVKYVRANGVTVSAVIPFTGFSGSTLGPDIGTNVNNTQTDTISKSFKMRPSLLPRPMAMPAAFKKEALTREDKIRKAHAVRKYIRRAEIYFKTLDAWQSPPNPGAAGPACAAFKTASSSLDEGDFLETSIGQAFETSTTPVDDGGTFDGGTGIQPRLSDESVTISTVFAISYGYDGGLSSKVNYANPRLTSVTPGLTGDYDKTGTYTLQLVLPIESPSTNDSRRIIACKRQAVADHESELCVEEDYTQARYDALVQELSGSTGGDDLLIAYFTNNVKDNLENFMKDLDARVRLDKQQVIDDNYIRVSMNRFPAPTPPGTAGTLSVPGVRDELRPRDGQPLDKAVPPVGLAPLNSIFGL